MCRCTNSEVIQRDCNYRNKVEDCFDIESVDYNGKFNNNIGKLSKGGKVGET